MKTIIKAYHKNSDIVAYHKYEHKFISTGVVICEETFDENGKKLTFENSNDYSSEYTRDENGNIIAYKNSDGCYEVRRKRVTKEEYESFLTQLNSKDLDDKEAEIEGRKYKLKLIK